MQGKDSGARRRRSVLYVPASNSRAMDKARALDCDAVILDLEDSVAPEAKDDARTAMAAAVGSGFGGREVIVRCNGLDTPWGETDLKAAAKAGADAVLAPKIRSPADVAEIDRLFARAGGQVWAMIETAAAVLNLREIAEAAASTRLAGLVLGPNDLSTELRCRLEPGRQPLQPILIQMVAAARAHGLVALDGTYNDLDDAAGFEAECRQGAEFGFDGKTLVHPSQVEPCNRLFSPSPEEVAWARAVIDAFAAPDAEGKGAIRLQGRMVERLHLKEAERVLALADD